MLDDEKTVQQLEGHGRHGEEVERRDHLTMVLEKGQPAFAGITPPPNSPEIAGHATFRDHEAELEQLAMNLRGSPVRVLFGQASDQTSDFRSDCRPPSGPQEFRPRPGNVV